jgi:hypothetical protein
VIERWRVEYHTKRPCSALGYRLPDLAPLASGSKAIFTAYGYDIKPAHFSWGYFPGPVLADRPEVGIKMALIREHRILEETEE